MDTRQQIEIMQAYLDGKTIQFKSNFGTNDWYDFPPKSEPSWDWYSYAYRIKPESIRPKTWEEFCKNNPIKKGEAYINTESGCTVWEINADRRGADRDRNLLPNEKDAEAMIALCQLIQLRDNYNQGWRPDWEDTTNKYVIYIFSNNIICETRVHINTTLTFKSKELRDEFYENFRDLIEVAKPLL